MGPSLPALVLASLLLFSAPGQAEERGPWAKFYRPSPAVAHQDIPPFLPEAICLAEIFAAEARYGLPENMLLAIGLQEAGRRVPGTKTVWPWTANLDGRGHFFADKEALIAWAEKVRSGGRSSFDLGCMQVNQRWHHNRFSSLEEAADPARNVDYAARFLLQLHRETGDWWEAAGRYHSNTPALKKAYLTKLKTNLSRARAQRDQLTKLASVAWSDQRQVAPPAGSEGLGTLWSSALSGRTAQGAPTSLSIYSGMSLTGLETTE